MLRPMLDWYIAECMVIINHDIYSTPVTKILALRYPPNINIITKYPQIFFPYWYQKCKTLIRYTRTVSNKDDTSPTMAKTEQYQLN